MKLMGEATQEGVKVWMYQSHTHTMKVRKTLCGGLNTKKNGVKTGVDILQ